MEKTTQTTQSHVGHGHSHDGSCCGAEASKSKADPKPADKANPDSRNHDEHKPARSSGCCCG